MNILVRSLILSLLCVLFACEEHPVQQYSVAQDYQRQETPWLSHDEAKLRSQTVSNIEYYVQVDLTKSQRYSGFVEIKFDYKVSPYPLTIDFVGGEAEQIKVNNIVIPIDYSGNFINIPPGKMETGKNIITVQFSNAYTDNGTGLYRYTDPIDEKIYLYTYFKPYYGNRLFPVFDQPDLQATYKLRVVTPREWTVVSSVREQEVIEDGPYKRWTFPESPKISQYLFSLHAGPWHIWEGKAGKTPLRLMTRQSLAGKIDIREWFKITQQGFHFFENYFSMSYPYSKYDQLLVPDFNISGMENVATTTYSEKWISEGKATHIVKRKTANIILHELSHVWFGNLVSIEWWSDLWLKESFATFLAPLALSKATEYKDAWKAFFINIKKSAYKADRSITTHPVHRIVPNTKSAEAIFDTITYNKGAAILHQLSYYLDENRFRNGIRDYLNTFKNNTTDINTFLTSMEYSSGVNLQDWARTWVNTAGINQLKAEYQCNDGKISTFVLLQTAPERFPVLRKQLLQVALYSQSGANIIASTIVPVSVVGKETSVNQLTGLPCPLLVYPNHGDWGYASVVLDEKTLLLLPENINNIEDPLTRSMLWQSLWEEVTGLRMPLNQYLQIVQNSLHTETDTEIISQLLSTLLKANSWINRASPINQQAKAIIESFEDLLLRNVQLAEEDSDEQKIWLQHFIEIAQSEEALNYLSHWLQGKRQPKNLDSEQEIRWNAIIRLSTFNHIDLEPLLKLEQHFDKSSYGIRMALAVNARRPDPDIKAYWLKELIHHNNRQTAARLKQAMKYLFPPEQSKLHHEFVQEIFSALSFLNVGHSQELVAGMVTTILPVLCDSKSTVLLEEELEKKANLGLIAQQSLLEAHQENILCLAINNLLQSELE